MMKNKRQTENGFTLVEMAMAMIIISLLVAFAAVAFSGMLRRGFEKKTLADMEIVADAIAVYAQKHMRVPCPADPRFVAPARVEPYGTERGSGVDGHNFGTCTRISGVNNTTVGIIPFVTLGLPQRLAKDRFGNFLTYRVSATSAQAPATAVTRPINNWCMTRPYWHADTDGNGTTDAYVNPAKAAFCCGTWGVAPTANVSGDVQINGAHGALPNLSRQTNDANNAVGRTFAEYRATTVAPPTLPQLRRLLGPNASSLPPSFPAYVLVSHGQNGQGAYASGSGVRKSTAGMTVPETENANDTTTLYYASNRVSQTGGAVSLFRPDIDDIVFWETPSQVLGRIGGMSCSRP